ncbi:TonB family protein [Thalassobaculum sp. OXR-137]|uniref:energy transducer TonB n=1 Tax=Thalassobaculum sp. OXR-137 TaxID=3100173 RepID=UPI002AC9AA1D|nr:TonB family protein [Thalassobaculum sp. OXR-137]WPZ35139.1 TonB family protein [Thalassobaculum sp. OXR-137]
MRIRPRHMGLAVGVAVAIHVAAAIAMVLQPDIDSKGAAGAGVGGIQVSLGPSGGAPGSVAEVDSDVEKAEPVTPTSAAVAEPDTTRPETVQTQPPPVPVAATEPPPPPAPAETPLETAEVVEKVDEVIAIAEPERVAPPPPLEPVKIERPDPVEKPVEVKPEPVTVARVEPEAPPVETPPMPVTRPQPPQPQKPRVEQTPPRPAPQQTAALSVDAPTAQSAQPAAAQTQGAAGRSGVGQSQQSSTAQASSGGGRPGVTVDYASILQAWLEDHKEYPRRARSRRQEGVVMLYFVMDRAGNVLDYRIDRSSGYDLLDREVEQMIQRAQPLPPMPAEMTQARLELVVPVQFQLR